MQWQENSSSIVTAEHILITNIYLGTHESAGLLFRHQPMGKSKAFILKQISRKYRKNSSRSRPRLSVASWRRTNFERRRDAQRRFGTSPASAATSQWRRSNNDNGRRHKAGRQNLQSWLQTQNCRYWGRAQHQPEVEEWQHPVWDHPDREARSLWWQSCSRRRRRDVGVHHQPWLHREGRGEVSLGQERRVHRFLSSGQGWCRR